MWIEKNNNNFTVSELQSLLSYQQKAEWNALDRFAQHQNILAGGLLAILGAGGASLGSNVSVLHYFPIFLPLLIVFLRKISIETLDRYYQRFLEAIVCTAKIEFLLGLDHKVWSEHILDEKLNNNNVPFRNDSTPNIDRYCKSRNNINQSESWIIEFMAKGHNDVAWRLFLGIYVGSLIFPLMAAFRIGWDHVWLYVCISFIISWILYDRDSKKIKEKRKNRT